MTSRHLTKPVEDVIEVSLFGPGFGECIVIHFGGDRWAVIDSARCPDTHQPVALRWLAQLGVSPDKVIMVVATHWDDDHIRGLGEVVATCQKASFLCSSVLEGNDEFMSYALACYEAKPREVFDADGDPELPCSEMGRVFRELRLRHNQRPIYTSAKMDESPLQTALAPELKIHCLAPANEMVARSKAALASRYLIEQGDRKIVRAPSPNNSSVVLYIRAGTVAMLLGGDLENPARGGWSQVVLDAAPLGLPKASFFKVPHHGSIGASCAEVWRELLSDDVHAALTPWHIAGNYLPVEAGRQFILERTGRAWITAAAIPEIAARITPKELIELASAPPPRREPMSHVCLRRHAHDVKSSWKVTLSGDAMLLKNLVIN